MRHLRCPFLTIMIALISVVPVFAQERRLAVVAGINAYRANSGLPKLQHAASDAAVLSATLRDAGFKVYEMTHDVARQDGQETMAPQLDYIRDQIRGILETPNLGDKDAVMITLHGHGVQFDFVEENGNKTPRFYFCPADATIDGVKTANDITDRHNLLPLEELYTDLADCKAATKLLVVDACRNDPNQPGVFREALASFTLPKLPPPTGGTAAFFSCKANQRAVEDTTLKNGVFTHFLVKGLQGEADLPTAGKPADGVITFAELSAYVANNTYAHVFDKFKVRQSPELRGDYDLNLPLAKIIRVHYDDAAIKRVFDSIAEAIESEDIKKATEMIAEAKKTFSGSHETIKKLEQIEFLIVVQQGFDMMQNGDIRAGLSKVEESERRATPEQKMQLISAKIQFLLTAEEFDLVVAEVNKLMEANGTNPELLNQIGWAIYETSIENKDLPQNLVAAGAKAAEKAMTAAPENGMIIDTVAHYAHLQGDLDRAIELQKVAIKYSGAAPADVVDQMKQFLGELEGKKTKAGNSKAQKAE